MARASAGVDTVIHLAAMIPPAADEQPDRARAVNVDGTANIIAACRAQPEPPRLLFTSTFDVHGFTLDKPPPRHVDDPVMATNPYTAHKIECEAMITESGLAWSILRLADVPILGIRDPHPIMFEIGLDNRIESLHADDAGLAIANALDTPAVWGRVLFIGGGAVLPADLPRISDAPAGGDGCRPAPGGGIQRRGLRHRLAGHGGE